MRITFNNNNNNNNANEDKRLLGLIINTYALSVVLIILVIQVVCPFYFITFVPFSITYHVTFLTASMFRLSHPYLGHRR